MKRHTFDLIIKSQRPFFAGIVVVVGVVVVVVVVVVVEGDFAI